MKYWDEFLTKRGFHEGKHIPEGAELYRDVYLKTVNKLAELKGSGHRYVPYDGDGDNCCLIRLVPKAWFDTVYLPQQTGRGIWQSAEDNDLKQVEINDEKRDDPMRDAISFADESNLDDFLVISVTVDDLFEGFLENLKADYEERRRVDQAIRDKYMNMREATGYDDE